MWAGVDSAWEQGKLEVRKMLAAGAAESHTSGAPMMMAGHHFVQEDVGLRPENSIITGSRRHFIPKKPGQVYNAGNMNGKEPVQSNGDDLVIKVSR